MKKIVYFFILLAVSSDLFAKPIDPNKAKTVGLNFLQSLVKNSFKKNVVGDLQLAYKESYTFDNTTTALYYIYNVIGNKGFVIVSADDATSPIIGYSTESSYDPQNVPPNFKEWMGYYKEQILYAHTLHILPTNDITDKWNELYTNNIFSPKGITTVNPLLTTTWDQLTYYNDLCPYDNTYSARTVTGCVATAMAQIMKYYNYPTKGLGYHSYNHDQYGTLSANFGTTTYDWASMPNNVTSTNTAVATLMYHCGVSLNMNYGVAVTGGSSASINNVPYALTTYFNYGTTVQLVERSGYSNSDWIALLKAELDASRPIEYAGFGNGGGHAFVFDGYDNSNYFHVNWGWSGTDNGYFQIDALNPATIGTGGGSGSFNNDQAAVIGIQTSGTGTPKLKLVSNVTYNPTPAVVSQAFQVYGNIKNIGSVTFNGDITAGIFTNNGEFVTNMSVISNFTLNVNSSTSGMSFSSSSCTLPPGNYYVGIYTRENGGNWSLVDNGSYTNYIPFSVNGATNNMVLNSAMVVTPATFVRNQPASVNLNIKNNTASIYKGTYNVAIYDLTGNFVESFSTLSESSGLAAGGTYNSPYKTFTKASVTTAPGTYILLCIYQPLDSSSSYILGSASFSNPVFINVVEPPPPADAYEPNNTEETAYTLATNFIGNTARDSTQGSNIHIGSDQDYYKIILPDSFNYVINARVHDSKNSGNGITYTNDVVFSYNSGSGWSPTYDATMPNSINISDSATVIFHVAPYFSGSTGTYLLDIDITRTRMNGIAEQSEKNVYEIFPNPVSGKLFFNADNLKINRIDIYDDMGQLVLRNNEIKGNYIDVSALSSGMYIITMTTDKSIIKSKINVAK